jgi:phosphatidylglycerol lysyltransferase
VTAVALTPLSFAGWWVRRITAALVAVLGAVDVVSAATSRPPLRAGLLGVDYAVAAIGGARYMLLAAGVAALLVVRGLLHGKRAAWWMALLAAVVSLPSHHVKEQDLLGGAVALVALAALLATRRVFVARSDPALTRRGSAVLVGGLATVFAYAATGLYWLDAQFRHPTTVWSSLRDAGQLLFLLPVDVEPVTRHGHWFVESVRTTALFVVIVGLVWLVATVVGRPGQGRDRTRVADLLDRYATTVLAHFHLLADKAWLFAPDGEAFVGYAVVGTTAVALGEPIGREGSTRAAANAFVEFCALNGWTPVFHQVTPAGRGVLADIGLKALKIGEEAIVELPSFRLEGRGYKSVRSALRRCERAGYRVVDLPHPVDEATLAGLRAVSDAWLAASGHRERTFTLGRFDPAYLRGTPVVAVVDNAGHIQAFANVLPTYRSPDASFDLMRRRPDAVNGVMDQLLVALVERFRAAGYQGMNLGLAPLAGAGNQPGLPGQVIRLLYERGGAAFNFAGLRAYKDKWHPRWEPRYLVYRFDTDLPKAATAVARVGELPDPRGLRGGVTALLRRFPVTGAFAALQLWIMSATTLDPRLHAHLLRHFGLDWHQLATGQLWRLVTAPLLQTSAGFVWSNLLLLAVVVPLAEWRLGSRITPLVFFGGDWLSTVPVFLGLGLAAAAGNTQAAHLAATPDAGSSAGGWALAAALAWSLPPGRWRRLTAGAVLGGLAVVAVAYHRLFDVQHLISATLVVTVLATRAALTTPDRVDKPGRTGLAELDAHQ